LPGGGMVLGYDTRSGSEPVKPTKVQIDVSKLRVRNILKGARLRDHRAKKNELVGSFSPGARIRIYGSLFSTVSQLTKFHQFSMNLARSFL